MIEVINTLGPKQTDSYRAGRYWLSKNKLAGKIKLHTSFEGLLQNLDKYRGQLLLVPTAFKSEKLALDWGELHYQNLDKLNLIDCFKYDLDELVLVENKEVTSKKAYTHRATISLLAQIDDIEIICVASKYEAYQRFIKDGRYVLTNQKNLGKLVSEVIIKHFSVSMIWAVYRIKE